MIEELSALVASHCVFLYGHYYIYERSLMVNDNLISPVLHLLHEILKLLMERIIVLVAVSQFVHYFFSYWKVYVLHLNDVFLYGAFPEFRIVINLL